MNKLTGTIIKLLTERLSKVAALFSADQQGLDEITWWLFLIIIIVPDWTTRKILKVVKMEVTESVSVRFHMSSPCPTWLHALNNDRSHSVFIYVLKKKREDSGHFPALSPSPDDKVKSDWPRWRRGVIYNHINPFVFYAGLGHCHSCPRGESHHLTCKLFPINIRDDEPFLYLHITPAVHQCPSWPFEHNEMTTGRTLVRSEIWAQSTCLTGMSTYRFTGSYWVKLVTGQYRKIHDFLCWES